MSSSVDKPDRLPLRVLPLSGVDALEADETGCQVRGTAPRLALLPQDGEIPSGWVLLRGSLFGRGARYTASLTVETGGTRPRTLRYDLPITRRATINELLHLPDDVRQIWLEPRQGEGVFYLGAFSLQRAGLSERVSRMYARLFAVYLRQPRRRRKSLGLHMVTALLNPPKAYRLAGRFHAHAPAIDYRRWIALHDSLTPADRIAIARYLAGRRRLPRVVLLVEGGGTDPEQDKRLRSALLYPAAFVSVADQAAVVHNRLDPEAWYVFVARGAQLAPQSLCWLVASLEAFPDTQCVYADHDRLDATGQRSQPVFKPDWSPELLRATDYIGPAFALRGDRLAASLPAGRVDRYDVLLRATEQLEKPTAVVHVPAVLFHLCGSEPEPPAGPDPVVAQLDRLGIDARVRVLEAGYRQVRYSLPPQPPLVSIIVTTRDQATILRRCLNGLLRRTTYPRLEVLVVDNQSVEPEALDLFDRLSQHDAVSLLRYDAPFNFAAMNNLAAARAKGEVLCLLNNDTEVIDADWLEEMVSRLLQPGVGVVGAKLLYGDGRVQHGGDVVGPGGCAWHLHTHLPADAPGYCHRALLAQELSAVTGACLVTHRTLYQDLGGMDARHLAVSFNDVDYCLRVRATGLRVIWTPHAVLYHHESVTRGPDDTPEKQARSKREANYMRKRWKQAMRRDPYYNPNLSYARADFSLNCAPLVVKPWRPRTFLHW